MVKKIDDEKLNKFANATKVQKFEMNQISENQTIIKKNLDVLTDLNSVSSNELDILIEQVEAILNEQGTIENLEFIDIEYSNILELPEHNELFNDLDVNPINEEIYNLEEIKSIKIGDNWDTYYSNVEQYASENNIDFLSDPFKTLLTEEEKNKIISEMKKDYTLEKPKCDNYDYLLASISGIIAGFIDVFFIGSAISSEKGIFSVKSDKFFEHSVVKFSDYIIESDKKNGVRVGMSSETAKKNLQNRVQYLEKRFKVNYDARYGKDLEQSGNLRMNPSNHHYVSLAHSPGLEGLLFSLLDQFTNKGSYLSNGSFIRSASSRESSVNMQGNNVIEKIFFGVVQWFGHNMSDIIGSNSSVANGNRGSGLPIPMTQFFQLFNNKKLGQDDISRISREVFENGYDFRHGVATTIPVLLNELLITFFWMLKAYISTEHTLQEVFLMRKSPELRRMLLVGHGTLCLVDGADGLIKSGGNPVLLFSRMNITAWGRFGKLALDEVRMLYGATVIDIEGLDRDLEENWNSILEESRIIK